MRTLLCPGDIITYTCALSSSSIITIALWTGSGFQCTGSPVNSTIILTQLALSPLNTVPVSCGSLSAVITNISGTCYTTVLTIPTPQYFNGTTVTCRDGIVGTLIGSDTLQVQLAIPPNTPAITSVISNYSDQLTVTWASVPTATSYNVSINGSTPISLPANASIYSFTGLAINTAYNLLVLAINCAGSSNPTAITGTTADTCTAAAVGSFGTAVGVSISVTFVVSFSMGVLMASVLCYIPRRSHKASSHSNPATTYDEVITNKKVAGDVMEMNSNTAEIH
eukprot:Em0005g1561a